jgi:hypothetical protein
VPILNWNISQTTLDNYLLHDAQALAGYKDLYTRYYKTDDNITDGTITSDCLGMSKYLFCAYSYPICIDKN